jgi:excisionase family DNA binding protein
MAQMRFPRQALELLREEDPGTSVSLNFIRGLIYSGKIPCVKVGRRHLINMEDLKQYLENPAKSEETPKLGVVRRIRA